ncbi:hypothetical protein WA538_003241 [Blastocystis sp. DL]
MLLTYNTESAKYPNVLRILVSIYANRHSLNNIEDETFEQYASFLRFVKDSPLPTLLYLYLFVLCRVDIDLVLTTLVELVELHPRSFFLHCMFVTFFRFVTEKEITEREPLDPHIRSVVARYVDLDPSSLHVVFDLRWLFERKIIEEEEYVSYLQKCCEFAFSNQQQQLYILHLLIPFKRRFLADCAWWLRYIPQMDVRWTLCQYFRGENEAPDESAIEELVESFEKSYASHQLTFEIDVESFWESFVSSTNT